MKEKIIANVAEEISKNIIANIKIPSIEKEFWFGNYKFKVRLNGHGN
jgi:hypothetical protein